MDSLETNVTTAPEQSSEITEMNTEPEVQAAPEAPAAPEVQVEPEAQAEPEVPVYTTKEEVVNRVKEIAQSGETGEKQELDLLKQLFYKFHNAEIQEARQAFIDGGGEPEKFEPQIDPIEPEFRASMQLIRDRRAAAQEELERQKAENLKRKLEILDRIQQLASTPEEANSTFDEFKALQAEWKEIKLIPAERATELWKNYQLYVEQFYDLLKLGHELRDYDFRKNLEAKTRLCEEAEALTQVPEVVAAYNRMLILNQEWKETGPVAREFREEIWNRFKTATTAVYKRHQDFFEARKAREEENLAQKTALCEQLEAISTDALKTSSEWDNITKKIIEMQTAWKTIGFAPQKMNTAIFERFRKGCDAFFEKKAQFFQTLKESLNENLAKKKELVEKAESLKDSTEWRSTGDILVNLQKQWKEIGNVPHKYSEELWKRFVGACDHFFEARQQATAGVRDEQNANKEQKLSIIEQLKELAEKGGDEIMQQVKELQKKWNEVGHVPFRDKDKLYKDYREVCDKIYGALNASQAKRHLNNFRNNLAQKLEKEGGSLSNERQRMMRAYERMRDELNTYENNLGFLSSNSKKGNSLVDSMKKKVEKLRDELSLLAQKIKAIDEQIANEGK